MKIIFMGTPDFAVPALQALVDAGHEVVAVYSQPPRRAGRGKHLSPTPVHARADELGIPVFTPETLRDGAEQAQFASFNTDVAVVAAYGLILPKAILDAPRLGCINIHASLLPRWRGAAPVQRAILAGDEMTGICIMQMEKGLDTGPVFARAETPVDSKDAGALTEELSDMGATLLVQVLADFDAYAAIPQEGEATYAHKIDKAESRIDFSLSAVEVERQIRAFAPAPGAWFEHMGERFRILAAAVEDATGAPGTVTDDQLTIACRSGTVRPTLIQRAGKSAMTPQELLRGFALPAGTEL